MDNTKHSITSDITAQRATLRTADTAPDREWRHNRHATVHGMTDTGRFTILLMTPDATARVTTSGVLAVEVSRQAMAAIVSDYDVVGWQS